MPDFSYQKNAKGLSAVKDSMAGRMSAVDQLGQAKREYADIANERLANIAAGDSWNPWLAMKMWGKENFTLDPLASQAGISQQGEINRRDSVWDSMKAQAEAAAQSGKPFKPNFQY